MQNDPVPQDMDAPATRRDLAGFATKRDLADFATKRDLADFATKRDLTELQAATKLDLAELQAATKRDLAEFQAATKRDFAELQAATKQDFADFFAKLDFSKFATKDDLAQFVTKDDHRRLEMTVMGLHARIEGFEYRSTAKSDAFRSEIWALAEGFGVKHLKTDRAQVLMGDRMDLLEGRVKALESRQNP